MKPLLSTAVAAVNLSSFYLKDCCWKQLKKRHRLFNCQFLVFFQQAIPIYRGPGVLRYWYNSALKAKKICAIWGKIEIDWQMKRFSMCMRRRFEILSILQQFSDCIISPFLKYFVWGILGCLSLL